MPVKKNQNWKEQLEPSKKLAKQYGIELLSDKQTEVRKRYQDIVKRKLAQDETKFRTGVDDDDPKHFLTTLSQKPGLPASRREVIERALKGSEQDLQKCFDMALDEFQNFDLRILSEGRNIDSYLKNYDELTYISRLSRDRNQIYAAIEESRKKHSYQIADEKLAAAMEFADGIYTVTSEASSRLRTMTRPEWLLMDTSKVSRDQYLQIMTECVSDSKVEKSMAFFAARNLAERSMPKKNLPDLVNAQKRMKDPLAAEKGVKKSVSAPKKNIDSELDRSIGHSLANIDTINRNMRREDGERLINETCKVMYLRALKVNAKQLGEEQLSAMMQPDAVRSAVKEMNPQLKKIIQDVTISHFRKLSEKPGLLARFFGKKMQQSRSVTLQLELSMQVHKTVKPEEKPKVKNAALRRALG